MHRRAFLSSLIAAAVLDPERLLWVPGKKLISIPKPATWIVQRGWYVAIESSVGGRLIDSRGRVVATLAAHVKLPCFMESLQNLRFDADLGHGMIEVQARLDLGHSREASRESAIPAFGNPGQISTSPYR